MVVVQRAHIVALAMVIAHTPLQAVEFCQGAGKSGQAHAQVRPNDQGAQETSATEIKFAVRIFEIDPEGSAPLGQYGIQPLDDDLKDDAEAASKVRLPELTPAQARELLTRLKAQNKQGVVRCLAEPVLVTRVGREAWFNVGGEVPRLQQLPDGTTTVIYEPFGTGLQLLPRELLDGTLKLNLKYSFSELLQAPGKPQADPEIIEHASFQRDLSLGENHMIALCLRGGVAPRGQQKAKLHLILIESIVADDTSKGGAGGHE